MFTGIITDVATVESIVPTDGGVRVALRTGWEAPDFVLGESIAVDGCCLTVVAFDGPVWEAEASAETLARTTLGDRSPGDPVNLERALQVGDRLGGHVVSGHVDAVGRVAAVEPVGDCHRWVFSLPDGTGKYVIEKGSIAIDGISLTVNGLDDDAGTFEVMIIPHTRANTSLRAKDVGSAINLEFDQIGKYVERLVAAHRG